MTHFKTLFIATRPWSFPVSSFSVLITASYLFWRGWQIDWLIALWATVGIILFHAAGNLLSDWYDFRKGIDAEDTYGSKTLTSGVMTPQQVLIFAVVMLIVACINGLMLAYTAGWWLLLFGGLGAVFTIAYPWMKTHALGDLCILLEYGFIPALGTAYTVMHGDASTALFTDALWIVPAFATITMAVLHTNNTRDVRTDGRAGIRTFAMLVGREISVALYVLEVSLPYIWVIAAVCNGRMPWLALLVLVALPHVVKNWKTAVLYEKDDNAMNNLDEKTAQHQLMNGVLLCVAFVVAFFIP